MKKLIILLFSITLLIQSCTNNSENNQSTSQELDTLTENTTSSLIKDTTKKTENIESTETINDSIGNISSSKNTSRLRTDSLSIMNVADSINKGIYKMSVYDDYILLSIVENLDTDELYWFKTLTNLFNHSDGYLAEGIGYKLFNYFLKKPDKFINNIKQVEDTAFVNKTIKGWGNSIAGEIGITNEKNELDFYYKYADSVRVNCNSCLSEDSVIMNRVFDEVRTIIKSYSR